MSKCKAARNRTAPRLGSLTTTRDEHSSACRACEEPTALTTHHHTIYNRTGTACSGRRSAPTGGAHAVRSRARRRNISGRITAACATCIPVERSHGTRLYESNAAHAIGALRLRECPHHQKEASLAGLCTTPRWRGGGLVHEGLSEIHYARMSVTKWSGER